MMNPAIIYQQRIDNSLQEISDGRKRLQYIPWGRFLLFLAIIGFTCYSVKTAHAGYIVAAALSFAGFLILGWLDSNFKQKIRTAETRIEINKHEIGAIGGDFSAFDPGLEFCNENHPYTGHLDIFGKGSLFQCINRSTTLYGKRRLAEFLNHACQFRNGIPSRQEAIKELSRKIDFRQELQRVFFEQPADMKDLPALMEWLGNDFVSDDTAARGRSSEKSDNRLKFMTFISWTIPGITLAGILLASFGVVPYPLPLMLVSLQYLIVVAYGRQFQVVNQKITSRFGILEKYSRALCLIETTSFRSRFNKKLQDDLKSNEQLNPSQIIKSLSKLLNWMDSLNMIVSAVLNGLFMINIHLLIGVEKWRLKYRIYIPGWFEVLAEFDALSGLAAFSFNNPEFVFPEISGMNMQRETSLIQPGDSPVNFPEFPQGEYLLKAEKIGHPLIPAGNCVTNDFGIHGWKQFFILTGANMSGKSTFLRTIGTNYILAMVGAPVFAEKFIFTPVEIHCSIRTNDSLVKGESYFYAELRSLKEIIAELEQGHRKLILLDEILKGTNSSDKQSGSIALVKQLMKYDVVGIFATHDVTISTLINNYPDHIRNLCFEISIEDDRMEIDYKLRPGVCKNLNASYLMKKMGIILE